MLKGIDLALSATLFMTYSYNASHTGPSGITFEMFYSVNPFTYPHPKY